MNPLRHDDPGTIGRYRMLAVLGEGGMGRVYLASGPDGRLVAVKLVHSSLAANTEFRRRFQREVAASRAVSGAYTAAVIDDGAPENRPWLASVYVPGPDLGQVLEAAAGRRLPETCVMRLAAGLATALRHVHDAGLVHRDLKPSNVLLADDGPRLIDFGIARAADGMDDITTTRQLVGSPGFMSPEQFGGDVAAPSDVFALGSLLVTAASGAPPFSGDGHAQLMYSIVHADPDLSGLSPRARDVVAPCLAKDPADRPTAVQLLESIGHLPPAARPWPAAVHRMVAERESEVTELLESAPVAAEPDSGGDATDPTRVEEGETVQMPTSEEPQQVRWYKRTPGVIAAAAVLVVLLAAGGWFVFNGGSDEEPGSDADALIGGNDELSDVPQPCEFFDEQDIRDLRLKEVGKKKEIGGMRNCAWEPDTADAVHTFGVAVSTKDAPGPAGWEKVTLKGASGAAQRADGQQRCDIAWPTSYGHAKLVGLAADGAKITCEELRELTEPLVSDIPE